MVRPNGVRRIAETLTALFLLGASVHAPGSTLLVLAAALAVGAWAGLIGAVGPAVHRVGLVVIALVLLGATVMAGRLTDLAVSGPLLFAAIVLAHLARGGPKAAAPAAPAAAGPAPSPPVAAGRGTSSGGRRLARRVGEAAGRTGTVVTKEVERALPVGARRAGRLVGRMAARRSANHNRSD